MDPAPSTLDPTIAASRCRDELRSACEALVRTPVEMIKAISLSGPLPDVANSRDDLIDLVARLADDYGLDFEVGATPGFSVRFKRTGCALRHG